MNEQTVADQDARQRALDPSCSFIVQAPAGSGKTELLTQRYLRLLSTVTSPEEIYAITFTRKAAAEMRQRIVAALDAAQGPAPEAAHARLTWSLARAVLQRDEEMGWQLADNPNRLRVQTFDSLAHALARQLPLLSEFGASPNTTEQAAPYYAEAARATLRQLEDPQLGPALERLLVHLDGRQGQLEDLLGAMLARRDQWLPQVLRSPDGHELEAALENSVVDHLLDLLDTSDPAWLATLADLARRAAASLRGKPKAAAGILSWDDAETLPKAEWQDLARWQGLAELLLTSTGAVRRKWDSKVGFPAPSERGIDAAEKTRRSDAKEAVAGCANALRESETLRSRWHALRLLPTRGLSDGQQQVLGSLLEVLLHAVAELTLAFRQGGEVDFAETQIRAQRALGTPEEPTDAALALDYRLQHLLIDEFQDTSTSQYRLLTTLTASWQPGDGRTLFAVGDPMQSIYRFREAEVGLFLAAREYGIGGLPLEPLTLSVNFRSAGNVIDWVNAAFAGLFPAQTDVGRGAVPYAPSQAFADPAADAGVTVHPLNEARPDAEAQQVVELVKQALAASPDGQVAILARARRHLATIAGALSNAGINFRAVDIDPLGEQPVVRDLYHLTRALLHPADRLSWLVVLRAPWLGIDLPALLQIAEGSAVCLPERLADPEVQAMLDQDNRRRIERLLGVIGPELPARGRRPLREWVEGIWLCLGGAACAQARDQADAQAFLALLDEHENAGGLVDFARLQAALGRLYAAPDGSADGRVQLMTMHKAKGLEFDTVILPGLGYRPASANPELLYWLERTRRDGGVSLLMAPIRGAQEQAEPISDYLRSLEREKTSLETTRLLYVAATRAKRQLHLLGHVTFADDGTQRPPAAGSLLHTLWPAVAASYTDLSPANTKPVQNGAGAVRPLRRLAADWQPAHEVLVDEQTSRGVETRVEDRIEFNWAGDTARHVGTLVHRQLERIANEGIDRWPASRVDELEPRVRTGLRHLGVEPAMLESAIEKSLRALRNTLSDDIGRWILTAHAEADCEWALTVAEPSIGHYVIDRTFVDDQGTRWIIDYKTGDHLEADLESFLDQEQERYRDQLENYARILRLIEQRPIRLALYFPLFAEWRVWNYAE
jgi:ATP-dependent exoDNAse (exonuclease V) beta subunit